MDILSVISLLLLLGLFLVLIIITLISEFIIRANEKHFKKKHPDYKNQSYFSEFIDLARFDNPEKRVKESLISASIGEITIKYKFGKILVNWNKLNWEFQDTDQRRIWLKVSSDIILYQSLNRRHYEYYEQKEEMKLDRINFYVSQRLYAHKYEDFIYQLFSSKFYYSEKEGYYYDVSKDKGLSSDYILEKIKNNYSLSNYEALNLFKEFVKRELISPDALSYDCLKFNWDFDSEYQNTSFKLGDVLNHYWNIISDKDLDINKWSIKHKLPKQFEH